MEASIQATHDRNVNGVRVQQCLLVDSYRRDGPKSRSFYEDDGSESAVCSFCTCQHWHARQAVSAAHWMVKSREDMGRQVGTISRIQGRGAHATIYTAYGIQTPNYQAPTSHRRSSRCKDHVVSVKRDTVRYSACVFDQRTSAKTSHGATTHMEYKKINGKNNSPLITNGP